MSAPLLRRLHATAATLFAATAGVLIGISLAPADSPTVTDQPDPRVGLESGVARLPLPAGWEPAGRRSSLPGMSAATAVHGSHSAVALDIRAPEHPSLLPAEVVAAVGEPPRPESVSLGIRVVWRYELAGGRMVALTLPTTEEVVTIACAAPTTALADDDCEHGMRALRVNGASVLAPAPETAARIVLPGVLARLNGERRELRRALAVTQSARQRSSAAGRLGRAYRAAAARLRPVAAGAAVRLSDALSRLAQVHRALAQASLRRDAAAASTAGAAIERDERSIKVLLRAVSRATDAARGD